MRLIVEKNILPTDFERKTFLQGNTWGKKFPTLSWLIILKKILHRYIVCRGKKSITRGLEKNKFSPKPNYYSPRLLNSTHQLTHTFPNRQKSNENLKECKQDHHI